MAASGQALRTGQARARRWPGAWLAGWLVGCLTLALVAGRVAAGPERYNWAGLLESVASRQDPEGLLWRAAALLNLGRVVQALRIIDELAQLPYQSLAGSIIARCQQQVEQKPEDPAARQCLAVAYYALNQLDVAVVHMRRAAELEPTNPWPLNLIAIAQLSQNDVAGARRTAEQALAVDRGNQYAHLILSQVALRERNYLAFLFHYLQAPDAASEILEYLRSKEQGRR